MELKANELRIGNKIFFIICDKENSNLDEKKQITVDITDFEFIRDNNSLFEGIPLTEEWLLKFGFEIEELYEYNKAKKEGLIITYGDNFFYNTTNIEFVHQLQNLFFALRNKELEIKM